MSPIGLVHVLLVFLVGHYPEPKALLNRSGLIYKPLTRSYGGMVTKMFSYPQISYKSTVNSD